MHTPDDMTPAERELESALRALRPDPAGVNPTELAYRLGEAAGRRGVRRWQGIAGGAAMLGLAAAVTSSSMRPVAPVAPTPHEAVEAPAPVEARDALVTAPAPAPGMEGWLAVSSYARQRDRTLRLGPDVLGVEPGPARDGALGAAGSTESREQSDLDLFLLALTSRRRL